MAQRLGYDQALLAEVGGALARAVMHDMRWAVKERHGLGSVEPLHAGVFMVVQRFRGDLGLYVHLHAPRHGRRLRGGRRRRALPARATTDGGAHDGCARARPQGGSPVPGLLRGLTRSAPIRFHRG